jgi:hypothetical protein
MKGLKLIVLGVVCLLCAANANAQVRTVTTTTEVDLESRLAEPADPTNPSLDTALVITNLRRAPAKVMLVGYDRAGNPVGRARREVPGHGLVYVLASELTDANRFLGKVEAVGRGRLTGTAVLIGGPVTDLPAITTTRRIATCSEDEVDANVGVETVITFPVAVAIH